MAKTRMVTRTIKSTLVHSLCLNIETAEPYNVVTILTPPIMDAKKEIEALRKIIDNETEKFVAIVSKEEIKELYGMPEAEFLECAIKLTEENENDESEEQ